MTLDHVQLAGGTAVHVICTHHHYVSGTTFRAIGIHPVSLESRMYSCFKWLFESFVFCSCYYYKYYYKY